MLPGKGVQQGESRDKTLFIAELQSVEVGVELIKSRGNVAKIEGRSNQPAPGRIRPRESRRAGNRAQAERGVALIGVEEALQLDAMIADVGQVHQRVLGKRLLEAEKVALDVAVFGVLGDIGDVVGSGIEGRGETSWVALIESAVAWCGDACCRLVDGDKERVGRVDGQDIARAGAGVVGKAGAEAAADDYARRKRIGEADARSVVAQGGIDQASCRRRRCRSRA